MKTVLITGAEGFTGHYVRDAFEKAGYKVVGLVYENPRPGDYACDLTDFAATRDLVRHVKPDGVIHLAALSFVSREDQSAFYKVNVFGTLNLLEALEKEGLSPEKIVIASSANIYGNPQQPVIDESFSPNPVNHYAASKLAMEFMVKNWFEKFPILITRPFNYTGPGQDPKFLVPKIVGHYKNNLPVIELGNLDVARDFSDVRDVAQSYLNLFQSSARSEIVNLCSGQTSKLQDIISMMDSIAGYQIKVSVNPDFVRKDEINVLCGNPQKLYKLTGSQHTIELPKTLQDMYVA